MKNYVMLGFVKNKQEHGKLQPFYKVQRLRELTQYNFKKLTNCDLSIYNVPSLLRGSSFAASVHRGIFLICSVLYR